MESVEYEVWTCEVVNISFLLNTQKQPSLSCRSLNKEEMVKPEKRLTKKQKIEYITIATYMILLSRDLTGALETLLMR
eukprot:1878034-Pyramimonas_sp.AAC.1